MFAKFVDLGWWIPVALVGLVLVISGPSMLIAWLKLRQRNLGPILDANGWAVNARAKVNVPFGGALTAVAALPPGAERSMTDAYAEKRSPWPVVIVAVLVLGVAIYLVNKKGLIYEWTDGWLGTQPKPAASLLVVPAVAPGTPAQEAGGAAVTAPPQ
jgi:hypothetical protein